jgi:hypothetical protein
MPRKPYEHITTLSDGALIKAVGLDVLDQSGTPVRFGSLFEGQKTIVVFILAYLMLFLGNDIWLYELKPYVQ